MSLRIYKSKRDFDRTQEPSGASPSKPKARSGKSAAFVVQKHAASRLHYDLRLEVNGVLKSWAVPKGPSLDPEDKRLAVEVEDHPIEYGSFEGTIPKGEYGGGTVMLWDRGTWIPKAGTDAAASLRDGKIEFELRGKKLSGNWVLVRMHDRRSGDKPQWLLRKIEDTAARSAKQYDITEKLPQSVKTKRTLEEIAGGKGSRAVWSSKATPTTAERSKISTKKASSSVKATTTKKKRTTSAGSAAGVGPSKADAMPESLEPQLATLVDKAPVGDQWIHEVKFDGYRMLAFVSEGNVRLISRNGKDWSAKFAKVVSAVGDLGLATAILDGEIVAVDEQGRSSFQALQKALKAPSKDASLAYFLFDVVYLNGKDLRDSPLSDRREVLEAIVDRQESKRASSVVRFSQAINGNGRDVLHHACKLELEGIVSKRIDSLYSSGRGADWVKSKCNNRQEMVIGGFTDPQRSRPGFGALLLGYYRGDELVYAGKVGTGFDHGFLRTLHKRLEKIERATPAFVDPPQGSIARGAHWVSPELVCEVEFFEWTTDGHLRHPSFIELREDKDAREVVREKGKPLANTPANSKKARVPKPERTFKREDTSKPEILGVPITHPERAVFEDIGITKAQLAEYYADIAKWMMPHVQGRPLSVVRCPQGQGSQCFYQKNWDRGEAVGSHVRKIKLSSASISCLVPDEPSALVWLVQRGVLEVHTWGCQEPDLEHPDRMVFDLDPAPQLSWSTVVRAAQRVKERLEASGLKSLVKTTGGKGLHVIVNLKPSASWDHVKRFSKSIADGLVAAYPEEYIATMSKSKRTGKVFIDYLRNNRGATFVAPYSSRARPGAPVSMPVSWKSLTSLRGGSQFTVVSALKHLKDKGDPWQGGTKAQSLPSPD